MALIFKSLNIEAVNQGQYFGLGFLLGAIALFVGTQRLFRSRGFAVLPSLAASGLLGTTSVFWWMQRWYPALSAGLPVLVWALYFYVSDQKHDSPMWRRWSLLLVVAAATHAYLTIAVIPILCAVLIRRLIRDHQAWSRLLANLLTIGTCTAASMYVLGYFTLPSKWAQTGGYGWYSANVLGLFDSNSASRFLPDVPSLSGQYEPTAFGLGTMLLLAGVVVQRLRSKTPFGVSSIARRHAPLIVVLVGLSLLAITNTVSIASWSFRLPLPARLEHGLSIFRSSARLMWPALILATVAIAMSSLRRFRHASLVISMALVVQLIDSTSEIRSVALAGNGDSVSITYDEAFWSKVPAGYTTLAGLPAESLGDDWRSCALAAINSGRRAECGYFSRVQGLDHVNRLRTSQLLTDTLDPHVIYVVSPSWLEIHRKDLLEALRLRKMGAAAAVGVRGFSSTGFLLFPQCDDAKCEFLVGWYRQLEPSLLGT
jgi:hypothetical protein